MRSTLAVVVGLLVGIAAHPLPAAPSKSGEEVGKRWALLIGVDDYAQLGKLRFAGNDQRALAEQLIASGFPKDQVFPLHDKAEQKKYLPFRTNIERELKLVLSLAAPGDLVIVAFSGHGVQLEGKSYFCPLDAEIEKLAETCLPLEGVYEQMAKSKASLKLLLVDACRNDVLPVGRRSVAVSRSLGEFAGVKEAPPEGILLLASCGPGQVSMEDQKFGHGVFMHYLLEGLRGHAADTEGSVSLARLYDYASLNTKKHVAREFSDYQTPALKGEISGPFEVCRAVSVRPTRVSINATPVVSASPTPLPTTPTGNTITNSIGMKLVLIPAGEFMMGSPDSGAGGSPNEGPAHQVRITRPFHLGIYEVTQSEYQGVMDSNPSYFSTDREGRARVSGEDTKQFPVERVSWDNALEFCRRLSQKEGRSYRLPTEAEWEYACRAGTSSTFNFGDVLNGEFANCDGTLPHGTTEKGPHLQRTSAAGSYPPNAFGLFDMHGNVWEWCSDWYDPSYYSASPTNDPQGPTSGTHRVTRGGSWLNYAGVCGSAPRGGYSPGTRSSNLGFRVALVAE